MSGTKIERFMHDLGNALDRMNEVRAISLEENELAMEATIQRFEFTFELFWKTLSVLLHHAGIEAKNPRLVLRQAYSQGWIDHHDVWIALLDARNLTSHVYNEQKVQEIYQLIQSNASIMSVEYKKLKQQFAHLLD